MQDLGKYGYSQWSKLHDGFIIGEINIMGKDFLVCTAKDEGRYEFKKIFLNKSSNILIFVDYNWSGYQDITRNLVFVSGFIGWLADKGNEEIETYLKSEEIRTNKDIFTETRVVPKEQGE